MPKSYWKDYDQDNFSLEYYEGFYKGGFRGYEWKDVKHEQEKKLDWIEWQYRRFDIKSILFVACAKGFEVREARRRGYNAYGTEMSDYALEHSDKEIAEWLRKADIRDLSIFPGKAFDLVCAFDVIHIIEPESRKEAYKELNRVAKQGVVIRTRVLPAEFTEPCYDGTYDGEKCFRETMQSIIVKIEGLKKFKIFALEMGQRHVVWYAFGDEKKFPSTFEDEYYRGVIVE